MVYMNTINARGRGGATQPRRRRTLLYQCSHCHFSRSNINNMYSGGILLGACLYLAVTFSHRPPSSLVGMDRSEGQDALEEFLQREQFLTSSQPHTINTGILSKKPKDYFQRLQDDIDNWDPYDRCQRYDWTYSDTTSPTMKSGKRPRKQQRRIFFGALLAEEPYELLDIMAAETAGIFAGMVFVESNRTQSFAPRNWSRTTPRHERLLSAMFRTRVIVQQYVNEDASIVGLERENYQRGAIPEGWKALGMQPDDIGYIADTDECMTRDFLRAIQRCDNIRLTNYSHHQCNPRLGARLYAVARLFEGTPDCITHQRSGHHPSLVMGACIEGIHSTQDTTQQQQQQPVSPRINIYTREEGYGKDCGFGRVREPSMFPLWNPADFRMILCGDQPMARPPRNPAKDEDDDDINRHPDYSRFTGYHLHNFFADFTAIRHKYKTYGHATDGTIPQKQHDSDRTIPLQDIHADLGFLHSCVLDDAEDLTKHRPRVQGGLAALPKYFVPLYFQDEEYRSRRQRVMKDKVVADDKLVAEYKQQHMQPSVTKRKRLDLTR